MAMEDVYIVEAVRSPIGYPNSGAITPGTGTLIERLEG